MSCNPKSMIKIAAALGGLAAAAWFAMPQARELISASAPVLLVLICPISMLAMMWMMRGSSATATGHATSTAQPAAASAAIAVPAAQRAPGRPVGE